MCVPLALGALGASAGTTAAVTTGLSLAKTVGGFIGGSRATNKANRALLKQHRYDVKAYQNAFKRDVAAWKDDVSNNEIAIDQSFKDAMLKLAQEDLAIWKSAGQKSLKEQESYVALIQGSGGAHEQLGRRSKASVSRKKAVDAHGGRMAQLSFAMSSALSEADMRRDFYDSKYQDTLYQKNIDTITGRPQAGPPPPPPKLKKQPKFPWMQVAGDVLGGVMQFNKLKAPASGASGGMGLFGSSEGQAAANSLAGGGSSGFKFPSQSLLPSYGYQGGGKVGPNIFSQTGSGAGDSYLSMFNPFKLPGL